MHYRRLIPEHGDILAKWGSFHIYYKIIGIISAFLTIFRIFYIHCKVIDLTKISYTRPSLTFTFHVSIAISYPDSSIRIYIIHKGYMGSAGCVSTFIESNLSFAISAE